MARRHDGSQGPSVEPVAAVVAHTSCAKRPGVALREASTRRLGLPSLCSGAPVSKVWDTRCYQQYKMPPTSTQYEASGDDFGK